MSEQNTVETRIKELEDENHLLLNQLHIVQEKLEQQYSASQNTTDSQTFDWVDEELPEVLAENLRYRTLLDAQNMIHEVETTQALNRKLGNILIQGVKTPGTLLAIPAKLFRVWRKTKRQQPNKLLGGKGFDKAIMAYREDGLSGVDALLCTASVPDNIHANALTAVARDVMYREPNDALELAQRAYEIDPKPSRLKWLIFRLYEASEVLRAEALLDCLPKDIVFSDSEERAASQILNEAKQTRADQAKQQCDFSTRHALVEQRKILIGQLTEERDEYKQKAERSQAQAEQFIKANDELKQQAKLHQDQIGQLAKERDEYKQMADQSQAQVEQFTKARDELKQLAEQRQAEVLQLQGSIAEMEHRQRLFSEEMSRAEGQIGLIKDVLLLPEPGA